MSSMGQPGEAAITTRSLRRLAAQAAPGLLEEALTDARVEAKAVLQRQLVQLLLSEVGALGGPPAADAAPAAPVTPASAVTSPAVTATSGMPGPQPPDSRRRPACYLYGITSGEPGGAVGLSGIDGAVTEVILEEGLVAVVSRVAADSCTWATVASNEADVAALTPLLRAHERVLEDLLEAGPVLPMRFGLMLADTADVRHLLQANQAAIRTTLDRVQGQAEWGLTVSWDVGAARACLGRARPDEGGMDEGGRGPAGPAGPSAGRHYLHQRQADRSTAEQLDAIRGALAAELHRRVAELGSAAVTHRPDGGPTSGRRHTRRQPLLKASYLIAREDAAKFRTAVEQELEARRDLGLGGELTGPWPPYNFATLELAESRP